MIMVLILPLGYIVGGISIKRRRSAYSVTIPRYATGLDCKFVVETPPTIFEVAKPSVVGVDIN